MFEKLIKRTIWVARCEQDEYHKEWTDHPPRKIMCPECRKWLEVKEVSFIGPDTQK